MERSARLNLRTTPETKADLEETAALYGMNVTAYLLNLHAQFGKGFVPMPPPNTRHVGKRNPMAKG